MVDDGNSKNKSYGSQFGILIGFTGVGLVISLIISVIIWMMMTGESVMKMEKDMFKPQYYSAIMLTQVFSTLALFFIPAYLFASTCYHKANKFLGFNLHINLKQILLVGAILIITFPVSGALEELNKILPIPLNWAAKFKAMEDSREMQEAALININSFSKYLISLVVIGFLPALVEETFFRGALQNVLTRWFNGPWMAIILTSIIFSLVHFSYYGFLVRAGLGAILGLIFYYGKSIWLNIMLHFFYNGLQVTLMYKLATSSTALDKKMSDPGLSGSGWLITGFVSLLLLVWFFIIFKNTSRLQLLKYAEEPVTDETDFERWTRS